jgi:CubicO group peptidase (beta-lactamase class C family)
MKTFLTTACLFIVTAIAIFSFIAATVFGQMQTAKVNPSPAESVTARVDKLFAEWNKSDSPGCSLGVSQNGALVYERGYGMANLEYGLAITPASIFHVGSITKQFTAMSILLLAQRGQLSLDDDARKYITELPDFGSRLTIRHLLTHTSGLREAFTLGNLAELRDPGTDTLVKRLGRQKALNFTPGTEYDYVNTGYWLLGLIVERVSGQSLRKFADSNIFKPLGMTHTFFHDDPTMIVPNRAAGYDRDDAGNWIVSVGAWSGAYAGGNTGLYTTARDLLIWEQNFAVVRVGDPALVAAMQTPTVLTGGDTSDYGFGLFIGPYRGLRTIGHGGGDPGYNANVVRYPDQGLAVALLCNAGEDMNSTGLSLGVADVYLEKYLPNPTVSSATAAAPDISIPEKELVNLTGHYFDPVTLSSHSYYMKDGKLMIFNRALSPISQNRFKVVGGGPPGLEIVFVRPVAGGPMQVKHVLGAKTTTYYAVQSVTPTLAQLTEFTGEYVSPELDTTYTLTARNSDLVIRIRGRKDIVLRPIFTDAFQGRFGRLMVVKFSRDARGVVTGFTVNGGGVRGLRFDRVKR